MKVLGIAGVTKVDTRKSYFKQTIDSLKNLEEVPVFETYIRVDSNVEWSQDNNMPIMAYKGVQEVRRSICDRGDFEVNRIKKKKAFASAEPLLNISEKSLKFLEVFNISVSGKASSRINSSALKIPICSVP